MCHLNMEETSDGEFEILKGEGFNLESDCMRLACKKHSRWSLLKANPHTNRMQSHSKTS